MPGPARATTPRPGPLVEVVDLVRDYETVRAVDRLSFTLQGGEVLGLVGPNGAGKTSALRCLTGILRPTSGTVRIAGHDLVSEPLEAKRGLAFMPDEPHLFDYLTVEEHLRFVARIYGVRDPGPRIEALLDEMELVGWRDTLPEGLSRGMKQKLTIACGLIHDPDVLVFDEPLTGLDPGAIRRMKTTILERAEAGAGVLLSSHLLHLVEELCTRILVLQEGRVVVEGSLEEIRGSRPELVGQGLEDVFLALTERRSTGEGVR